MTSFSNEIRWYIQKIQFDDIKDLKDIEIRINSDFNTLCNYRTINEIINKHSIKWNETEFYKPMTISIGKYIKDVNLCHLIYQAIELLKPNETLEIKDLRQMCLECARLQNRVKWHDIYTTDKSYNEILACVEDMMLGMKHDRNLYVELLIRELDRDVTVKDDDNIYDLIRKINDRILPYYDDIIKYYKLSIIKHN